MKLSFVMSCLCVCVCMCETSCRVMVSRETRSLKHINCWTLTEESETLQSLSAADIMLAFEHKCLLLWPLSADSSLIGCQCDITAGSSDLNWYYLCFMKHLTWNILVLRVLYLKKLFQTSVQNKLQRFLPVSLYKGYWSYQFWCYYSIPHFILQ